MLWTCRIHCGLVTIWGGWINVVWLKCLLERWLIDPWKTCVRAGTHRGIHSYKFVLYMSAARKGIYCSFKICCIISVLFLTKCHLSHNFIFFSSSNMLFLTMWIWWRMPTTVGKVNGFHILWFVVILFVSVNTWEKGKPKFLILT